MSPAPKTVALPVGRVLVGDCTAIMSELPAGSIDLIFADPPYNLQLHNELYRPNMSRVDAVTAAWDHFPSLEAYDEFTRRWLSACRALLKETGTIWVIGTYHNIFRIGAILQDLGFWILNDIIWLKSNPMPNFRGVRLTNAHETLIWAQKRRGARYTFGHHDLKALNDDLQMRSDWTIPLAAGGQRLRVNGSKAHPTQKPEALLYRVLTASSKPGDVILDPFFGTGTTGAVAEKLGRQWIGIEQDAHYADLARRRISKVAPADAESLATTFERPPRVPFGALLEHGLLSPGQKLYLRQHRLTATVLANGRIRSGRFVGSIHAVAGALMGGVPANGWELWTYKDRRGTSHVIDYLRRRLQPKQTPTVSGRRDPIRRPTRGRKG